MSPAAPSEDALLEVAERAARLAAGELMRRFGHVQQGIRAKSSPTDLVSEADVSAERAIRGLLEQERPQDAILGEEGGATGDGALRWVVDPLDGTINFLFGIPMFAVSVACEDADGMLAGVVLDPVREECFSATRSGPARLGGEVLRVTARGDLSEALIATGFGYDSDVRARQGAVMARVLPRVRDIRRAGAAALDLVWCACRRFDGYYERGVKHWDTAAGLLVAQRAGLAARELPAGAQDPPGVLVGPPEWVDELHELVSPAGDP